MSSNSFGFEDWFVEQLNTVGCTASTWHPSRSSDTTIHSLKITDGWWKLLSRGDKSFELRRNDRDYQVGDRLTFTNLMGEPRHHERYLWLITHVLSDVDGLKDGFVGLSLRQVYR